MRKANQQLHNSKASDYSEMKMKEVEGKMSVQMQKKSEGEKKKSRYMNIKQYEKEHKDKMKSFMENKRKDIQKYDGE